MKTLLFRKMAVAGLYFRDAATKAAVAVAEVPTPLTLEAEPSNPHDSLAVKLNMGPLHIGYVPATVNPMVAAMLSNNQPLSAEYIGMDKNTALFNLYLDN